MGHAPRRRVTTTRKAPRRGSPSNAARGVGSNLDVTDRVEGEGVTDDEAAVGGSARPSELHERLASCRPTNDEDITEASRAQSSEPAAPSLADATPSKRRSRTSKATSGPQARRVQFSPAADGNGAATRRRRHREASRTDDGRPKPGAAATCFALMCANCWLLSLVASALLPMMYDGFNANEIDYWYPINLCPRHAAPSHAQYDGTMPFEASRACRGGSGVVTCEGGPSPTACSSLGCVSRPDAISSAAMCNSCCGGTLRHHSSPCTFPFRSSNVMHTSCAADHSYLSNASGGGGGASGASDAFYWCPLAVDENLEKVGNGGQCGPNCVQADYVVSGEKSFTCEPTCAVQGNPPSPHSITIGRVGWGGDAGFRIGAPYRLVIFHHAHYFRARLRLSTAAGRTCMRATSGVTSASPPSAHR